MDLRHVTPSPHQTYSLLELSPALLAQLEKGEETHLSLVGQANDESVMTTESSTMALRGVRSSNTMLLCQPSTSTSDEHDRPQLHAVASLNQTLDLVPVRPRVERVEELLRGQEWSNSDPDDYRPSKKLKGYTEEHLSQLVQASSQELSHYLARAHILHIGHRLRPVAPSYLPPFLSSLLLAADDKTGTATAEAFAQEADLDDLSIARQVLAWYTTSSSSSLDKTQIVKDIGSALLQSWPAQDFRSALTLPGSGMAAAASKKRVIPLSKLLERWKKWAGSDEHLCSADLLKGQYLQEDKDGITSVPASELAILEPQERFAFLFKLKPKWTPQEMEPFLEGMTVNSKDREKWVLKCVRKVKQGGDTVWLPR